MSRHGPRTHRSPASAANKGFEWRKHAWSRIYRNRMDLGLEPCRSCRITTGLTFDHITPWAAGGTRGMRNMTILCGPCNVRKSDQPLHLRSLADEEAAAAPERRWSQLAEQWDPKWVPLDCKVRLRLVPDRGAMPLLVCNLPAGHPPPHYDLEADTEWVHPDDLDDTG